MPITDKDLAHYDEIMFEIRAALMLARRCIARGDEEGCWIWIGAAGAALNTIRRALRIER